MTIGGLPQDDRAPEARRAALDPTLVHLLDTLAGAVADGYLDDAPALRDTTIAHLGAWGFDIFDSVYALDTIARRAGEDDDDEAD